LRVVLVSVYDKLWNGTSYSFKILHTNPCNSWAGSVVYRGHHWEENCTF